MDDPIVEIIGDYRAFATMQRDRLAARGIDIAPYPLSHLAYRVPDWDLYVHLRTRLVGEGIDECSRVHRAALTGQQFQSPFVEPCCVGFEDFTHAKFYRHSLYDACVLEGARFSGFQHVDDWVPQRIVTATGPNPLPR